MRLPASCCGREDDEACEDDEAFEDVRAKTVATNIIIACRHVMGDPGVTLLAVQVATLVAWAHPCIQL